MRNDFSLVFLVAKIQIKCMAILKFSKKYIKNGSSQVFKKKITNLWLFSSFLENVKNLCSQVFLLVQLHHAGEGELEPGGKK